MPVKTRVNRYSALRTPIASPRVTVEAWTLTSTSSSFGDGPLDVVDAQHLRRPVPIVDDCSHFGHFLSSVRWMRWMGVPCFQARPAR